VADVVPRDVRSRMMSGIRGKDTRPELFVRRALFSRGYRFRLHNSRLPGKPDICLRRHRAVIFVNGCFWHGHDCALFKWPRSNAEFWRRKILRNRALDECARVSLTAAGWRVLTIWECALKGRSAPAGDEVVAATIRWLESEVSIMEIRCG
jgi:DNA mismatch endonuclease (patch repair protein)